MKLFKLIFTMFFLVLFSSFIQKEKRVLNAEYIEKSVVKISGNLYASRFETDNWLYRQFISDLTVNRRKEELAIARVDSQGWLKQPVYIASLVKLYHTDKEYDDFPVVNISHEAAVLFCSWLSDKYNSFPDRKYKKCVIRLPQESEWMAAAKGKNPASLFPTGLSLKNRDSIPMANYRRTDRQVQKNPNLPDPGDILMLAPVKSYWPCSFGIYNMAGNAAEMISNKGITKGGGFIDSENALFLDAQGVMESPGSQIGFRYFLEVLSQ
ncbi:MAG TPA: SUMF1/EgtB/PvdO family nonheme iron enzyme [Bacteroidia bacterium]|nr:SUMF1/EgtB/PvdO family nonheme iron enzyme [Bacteroidia bacterium]